MFELSEERLAKLMNNIGILDRIGDGQGFMVLELSERVGLNTGYPRLSIHQFGNEFDLIAAVPSVLQPGYDTNRVITLEEMVTFVLVAKKKFPNERMTKELIKKVTTYLNDKQAEINRARELIE